MNIELDDSLMRKIGVDEKEALEFLAIALYKYKGIHGLSNTYAQRRVFFSSMSSMPSAKSAVTQTRPAK